MTGSSFASHIRTVSWLTVYPRSRRISLQIPQCQPVAQAAEPHEGDDVAWQASPVQHPTAAFVEQLAAAPAAKPAMAPGGEVRAFRHRRRAAANTIHRHINQPELAAIPHEQTHHSQTDSLARTLAEPLALRASQNARGNKRDRWIDGHSFARPGPLRRLGWPRGLSLVPRPGQSGSGANGAVGSAILAAELAEGRRWAS